MHKTCSCVIPNAKQCFYQEVCQLKLPPMDEVAMKLKKKYEKSLHSKIIPSSGHQHALVVDRENHQRVNFGEMIYFNHSPDYCITNAHYNIAGIAGRQCTLSDSSFSHHCDKLCCDHGYETFTYTRRNPCECTLIWCCRVKCNVCFETEIKNKCKSKHDVSST